MDSTASAAIFGDDLSLLIQHGWSDGIPPRPAYDYSMAIIQQSLQLYTDALLGTGVQEYRDTLATAKMFAMRPGPTEKKRTIVPLLRENHAL